ncbi:tyrosine-type recombinase/integrase [Rhodococcus pyridinivorans]|uniref:Phage integrase family protein n=1 Tax=Rhodococcus pyridinivorans AK37 TaxID=1114960 RepID=H0JV46_9NOCA|nr:tyrosine-type recombinase/integrase [Rhodococcus pyridinivorans]EHK82142.1 phage integrase family protein [Rhodococcus pyridinivorans AK37]MCD2140407.1 tyrosine-type recombinase/integrase [Rhodococcus pyridinivorans]
MSRPRIEIGQWGKISTKEQPGGRYRAWARYRDTDGQTRTVQAFGSSAAEAERRLRAALHERGRTTASDLSPATDIATLGKLWLGELEHVGELSPQTIAQYRTDVNNTICAPKTGIGGLLLREATTSRIDRFLKTVSEKHPAKARRIRTILSQMLGLAARHDAIDANPVRDVARIRGSKKTVRALTIDELEVLRRQVRFWEAGTEVGRPRAKGLLDLVDVLLGTGARIGEVLALRWSDIDLTTTPATATISGTVVRLPGRMADGGGLLRQGRPKTDAGYRVVKLPSFTRDTLLRLSVNAKSTADDLVFPSAAGTLRDPHNVRRQWRDARGERFAWVTPHSFRRTVATLIDREATTEDAASQLGHSGTAVTRKHYIEKAAAAPDLTAVLEQFGAGE